MEYIPTHFVLSKGKIPVSKFRNKGLLQEICNDCYHLGLWFSWQCSPVAILVARNNFGFKSNFILLKLQFCQKHQHKTSLYLKKAADCFFFHLGWVSNSWKFSVDAQISLFAFSANNTGKQPRPRKGHFLPPKVNLFAFFSGVPFWEAG